MKKIVLFVLLFITCSSWGQNNSAMQGQLIEEFSHDPICGARIYLQLEDAVVTKAETDVDGKFLMTNIKEGYYNLIITKQGLSPVKITNVFIPPNAIVKFNPTFENEGYDRDTIYFTYAELQPTSCPKKNEDAPNKNLSKKQEAAAIKLN